MPEPGNAGDADQQPERNLDVETAQVVGARAAQPDPVFRRARFAPPRRDRNRELTGEIFPGDRVGIPLHLGHGARGQHASAKLARAGAEIEQIIRRANHIGIVLDDEDCIAQIAQVLEDPDELGGVARMQADRRLVQHIQRTYQLRAERSRELNALRFSAGESRREAIEREVVEPDRVEKMQPLLNLVQDAAGDLLLHGRELQRR